MDGWRSASATLTHAWHSHRHLAACKLVSCVYGIATAGRHFFKGQKPIWELKRTEIGDAGGGVGSFVTRKGHYELWVWRTALELNARAECELLCMCTASICIYASAAVYARSDIGLSCWSSCGLRWRLEVDLFRPLMRIEV